MANASHDPLEHGNRRDQSYRIDTGSNYTMRDCIPDARVGRLAGRGASAPIASVPTAIIIGLAGEVVSGIDDLQRVLTEDRIGERVEAVMLRDGKKTIVTLIPTDIHEPQH